MVSPLWSLSNLETLLSHPEPEVQGWAAARLFLLYPGEAQSLLPRLLSDGRPAVVQRSLEHAGNERREELIPILKDLYLRGEEPVSARAIGVLADWHCSDAVNWMRERIVTGPPLGREEILSMIHALGRLPDEDAYRLLKQTEQSVEEKDFPHWDAFYASLLEHRRLEDAEALIRVVGDESRTEERRRNALGLLLAQVDPGLNPSNIFFTNHPAVREHWLDRLEKGEAGARSTETDWPDAELRDLILKTNPDDFSSAVEALQGLLGTLGGASAYEAGIVRAALGSLEKNPCATEWHYGLMGVAVSAVLTAFEERAFPAPAAEAPWREKAAYVLRNLPPRMRDESYRADVIQEADRAELVVELASALQRDAGNWSGYKALEMLGELRAEEAADLVMANLKSQPDELFSKAAMRAFQRMGISAVSKLIPLLDSPWREEKVFALEALAALPTEEGVRAVRERLASLYSENPSGLLDAIYDMGAEDFVPFVEREYRPGEWELGGVYLHLCRLNGLETPMLADVERDVKRGDEFTEENRRLLAGEPGASWPSTVYLELACRQCGKLYHYEVHEVHMHPRGDGQSDMAEEDWTPYRNGVVIVDNLRCKNCGELNQLQLTAASMRRITFESLKSLALERKGLEIPSSYPVKKVRLDEKEGKPVTLLDAEKEYLDAIRLHPSKPAGYLALAKFYEYVKEHIQARRNYLQALNIDSHALEAMAGLARLDYAEEKFKSASDWIQSCYENLDKGHVYLTKDVSVFKKVVRQKRKELAREAGAKPVEKTVDVRFRVDEKASDHPRNKPCPCGSGKKYKLCCMKR